MQRYLFLALASFALSLWGKQMKVNLQWSICDSNPQTILQKLSENGSRKPYKKTPITYFDTNPPSYSWVGLMFRTKTRRGEELSAVKARFDPTTSDAPAGFFGDKEKVDINRTKSNDSAERFLCVWDRRVPSISLARHLGSVNELHTPRPHRQSHDANTAFYGSRSNGSPDLGARHAKIDTTEPKKDGHTPPGSPRKRALSPDAAGAAGKRQKKQDA
ncbi:hypothetical protein S40288_10348 [Stachybotrys chartarum IBT 40288]|nr:hypothetical protein S40288_10348 [Stachybotrys chartarum IBT 40288]